MSPSWPPHELPKLTLANHQETSPPTRRYNCIAWAAGNDSRWWWPDLANTGYWPPNVPREETVAAFVLAYETLGYAHCADGILEVGFEKIAIYAQATFGGALEPTHAARQLQDGTWTSKLGRAEDISHSTPDDVNGPKYGLVVVYMRRPAAP